MNIKEFQHDIDRIVVKFDECVEPISSLVIEVPDGIKKYSFTETIYDFMKRFSYLGHSSNRYNEIGISLTGDELQKLDRVVYIIRGWFAPLRRLRFENHAARDSLPQWTWREAIMNGSENLSSQQGILGLSGPSKLPEPKKSAFCHQNAAFLGAQNIENYSFRSFVSSSAPQWNILIDIEGEDLALEERVYLAKWFLENVRISQSLRIEIQQLIRNYTK